MRNGSKHKMMPLLSPFTTCVLSCLFLPDEMEDVLIAGLQWFILIPRLNHTGSHRPIDSYSKLHLHREKKNRIWNTHYPACCNPTNYGESSHSSLILVASYDMPYRKAEVLFYTVKKTRDPTGM